MPRDLLHQRQVRVPGIRAPVREEDDAEGVLEEPPRVSSTQRALASLFRRAFRRSVTEAEVASSPAEEIVEVQTLGLTLGAVTSDHPV